MQPGSWTCFLQTRGRACACYLHDRCGQRVAYTDYMIMRCRWPARALGLACVLTAFPALTMEADADIARDESGRFPYVSASYTYAPSADFETVGMGRSIKAKESQFVAGVFQFEAESVRFDFGLDYQYNHYAYQNIDGRDRDLHRLQFPIGFSGLGKGVILTGFVAPGVATSSNIFKDLFDRGSSDDIVVTGRIEAQVPRNPRLAWLGGIAFDRSFGEDRAYPVIGLILRPDDRLGLRLAFPESSVRFRLSQRQQLSAALFPAGYAWHVVSDTLRDDFDYEMEAIRLQGIWSYRFADRFAIDLSVGYEFDRRHRFVDDTGRIIDSSVDNQFLAGLGLRWGDGPVTRSNHISRFDSW